MSIFAFVMLTACKDPASLVGDSNIYADPIEVQLEAISFDEKTMDEEQEHKPQPGTGSTEDEREDTMLDVSVNEDVIAIFHENIQIPCNFISISEISAYFLDRKTIVVDYGYDIDYLDDSCFTDIAYRLQLDPESLPEGIYTLYALDDVTEFQIAHE